MNDATTSLLNRADEKSPTLKAGGSRTILHKSYDIEELSVCSKMVDELLVSINRDVIDNDYIARKISCDHALTVKTLKLANSSFYGMEHTISSVQEAIAVLGFHHSRRLIQT